MKRTNPIQRKLRKLIRNQTRYQMKAGGIMEIKEGDETYNRLTRLIAETYVALHPKACLGTINLYGIQRLDLLSGKIPALREYHGEHLFNFDCDFIVPEKDPTLEDLLLTYNNTWSSGNFELLDTIFARIQKLGGEMLLWS